ncbi:MipA/OmpV family protein [Sulfurimonas sp.]
MKFLISISLFLTSLFAQEIIVGAGPYIQTQPYKDVKNIVVPSPVIFFDNSVFYVRWSRAGLYFLGDRDDDYAWGFSITAQPRVNQYKASDSYALRGMKDKDSSVEAGLAFSASVDKSYIEIMALTDVLDRHDSWILKTELGYDFELGKFKFYPSAIFIYQSSKFIDYYYGVDSDETIAGIRDVYKANDGLQIGAQTYIKYPLTDKLSVLANIRVDKLSNEAISSPIVEDDYIYSGLLSLIYKFNY